MVRVNRGMGKEDVFFKRRGAVEEVQQFSFSFSFLKADINVVVCSFVF